MKKNTLLSSNLKALIKQEKKSNIGSNINSPTKYWTKSIIKLAIQAILIIWAVFTLVYILINLIPGDPKIINDLVAAKADPAVIESMRNLFHLNDGYLERYFIGIGDIFNGTLGISGTYGVPVSNILWSKMLLSFQIGFIAIAFSILIGVPIGIAFARRKSTSSDIIAGLLAVVAFAIPAFVIAIIFMYISYLLGLPIIFEYGNWYTILIPALAISIPVGFTYSRYLRSSVREEYRKQYVALAKVKGVNERRLLWRHIFKPSLYPIVTYFPIIVTMALFGSITVETVFAIPGSGQLLVDASLDKDQSMILAISVIYTGTIVLAFFFRDILLRFVDPRLRTE